MATTTLCSIVSLAKSLPSVLGSSHGSFHGNSASFRPASLPVVSCKPLTAFMMAKREDELEDIRKMSDEALKDSVVELKGELLILRMKQKARQDVQTSEFRRMRKRVARMLTVHRERELVQGIKKRDSRKLDRAWKRSIVVKPAPSLVALMEQKRTEK